MILFYYAIVCRSCLGGQLLLPIAAKVTQNALSFLFEFIMAHGACDDYFALIPWQPQRFFAFWAAHKYIFLALFPLHRACAKSFFYAHEERPHFIEKPCNQYRYISHNAVEYIELAPALFNIAGKRPEQNICYQQHAYYPKIRYSEKYYGK